MYHTYKHTQQLLMVTPIFYGGSEIVRILHPPFLWVRHFSCTDRSETWEKDFVDGDRQPQQHPRQILTQKFTSKFVLPKLSSIKVHQLVYHGTQRDLPDSLQPLRLHWLVSCLGEGLAKPRCRNPSRRFVRSLGERLRHGRFGRSSVLFANCCPLGNRPCWFGACQVASHGDCHASWFKDCSPGRRDLFGGCPE